MTTIVKRGRKLRSEDQVFTQNAWDDTEWTSDMIKEAEARIERQKDASRGHVSNKELIECEVGNRWNQFYAVHVDKFFKDRRWILSEFTDLLTRISNVRPEESCNILEVGCGVGNAIVQIVENNKEPNLKLYCCDLSHNAIEILKKRDFYITHEEQIVAFQADICYDFDTKIRSHIEEGSLDYIMLIFTLSALKPERHRSTICSLAKLLKPGGKILFRDYARFDLTQLRFKGSALLDENYYIRADGTTSYFFTRDYIAKIFTEDKQLIADELNQDNRLLVNRSKGIKMSRCWIQGTFRKCSLNIDESG